MYEHSGRLALIGIDATNSVDFLKSAFEAYDNSTAFAILRSDIELDAYPGLEITTRHAPGTTTGWATLSVNHSAEPTSIAHVVFSSGTEGRPKAIAIPHRAIEDVERRLIEAQGLTSDVREYIGVPVTYSFGFGRARAVSRVGGSFYVPDAFDPREIRDMLARDEINAISAVPSLWRLFLAQPEVLGQLGNRVRWIEIGSQYMSGAEKAALRDIFPAACIVQHYGLTEASRSTFLRIDGAPEWLLDSVGPVDANVVIGPEGEICLRGDHLAAGVVSEEGALVPLTDKNGWLHTRDGGEIRDGALYFLGRLDDQINLSGLKLAAENLEAALADCLPGIAGHFAVTSIEDPLRGEVLLIARTPDCVAPIEVMVEALTTILADRGIAARGQICSLEVDTLPRTGSNKIQRKLLRALWRENLPTSSTSRPLQTDEFLTRDEQRVAQIWRSVVGAVALAPHTSFYDVGGDSLAAMQIGLAMEAHFPPFTVRATLEGRTLAEVAATLSQTDTVEPARLPDRTIETWALNITRGLMVISVLLSHWLPGVWTRVLPDLSFDPIALVSRMGTPGFAIVFGIGVGYFMLNDYPSNRRSTHRRLSVSLTLVATGMVLLSVTDLADRAIAGQRIGGLEIAQSLYSVLAFYLLALLTIPLWLRLLAGRVVPVVLFATPLLWGLWLLANTAISQTVQPSLLEWPRLMAQAKYSYFHMMAYVLVGCALGWHMFSLARPQAIAFQFSAFGAALLIVGLAAIVATGGLEILVDRTAAGWNGPWAFVLYTGVVSIAVGSATQILLNWHNLSAAGRMPARLLILFGGLALPIFVFHEAVIPLKDILIRVGLDGHISLGLTLAMFFCLIGYGMKRLDRMYFG